MLTQVWMAVLVIVKLGLVYGVLTAAATGLVRWSLIAVAALENWKPSLGAAVTLTGMVKLTDVPTFRLYGPPAEVSVDGFPAVTVAGAAEPLIETLSTQASLSPVISNLTTAPLTSCALSIAFVMVAHDAALSVGHTVASVVESIVVTSWVPTYRASASLLSPVPAVKVSREQSNEMDADVKPPRLTERSMV